MLVKAALAVEFNKPRISVDVNRQKCPVSVSKFHNKDMRIKGIVLPDCLMTSESRQ